MPLLKQTQWFLFNNYFHFVPLLHNFKSFPLYGNLPVIRTKCNNKIQNRSLKKLKLTIQSTKRENNNKISKTDSESTSSGQFHHSSIPNTSRNTNRKQESNNSDCQESIKKSDKSIYRQIKTMQNNDCNSDMPKSNAQNFPTNFYSPSVHINSGHFNMVWSASYQGYVPQCLSTPLIYRSLSDSRIQHTNNSNLTVRPNNRSSNSKVVPRSSSTGPSNWTMVAQKDRAHMWKVRTWQRTPLGRKLSKVKQNSASCTFSVMSYNVLAQDLLAEHPFLYRNHHPKALLWEERWKNVLHEIKQHDADILCLQEVQASHVDDYYSDLDNLGYVGLFKQRTGYRTDGCAIYYKTSKFKLIDHTTVEFYQSNITILNRDNVAIIAKFAPKHNLGNEFVVATTHLLYNRKREDVRLAQTQVLLSEVDRMAFRKGSLMDEEQVHVPIIICGDFNLTPESPVYQLIVDGVLKYDHLGNKTLYKGSNSTKMGKLLLPSSLRITDDCKHAELMEYRKENVMLSKEEELKHVYLNHNTRHTNKTKKTNDFMFSTGTLTHDLALKSAYDHRREEDLEATTYQDQWVTVDYVFYSGIRNRSDFIKDGKLKLISRYLIPTAEQMKGITIPNFAVGSDHLSLVVKFQLDP